MPQHDVSSGVVPNGTSLPVPALDPALDDQSNVTRGETAAMLTHTEAGPTRVMETTEDPSGEVPMKKRGASLAILSLRSRAPAACAQDGPTPRNPASKVLRPACTPTLRRGRAGRWTTRSGMPAMGAKRAWRRGPMGGSTLSRPKTHGSNAPSVQSGAPRWAAKRQRAQRPGNPAHMLLSEPKGL